jgi:hypothetical protein
MNGEKNERFLPGNYLVRNTKLSVHHRVRLVVGPGQELDFCNGLMLITCNLNLIDELVLLGMGQIYGNTTIEQKFSRH